MLELIFFVETLITSSEMMNAVGIAERICNDLSFHVFSPSSVLAVCQEHLNGNPRTHEICQVNLAISILKVELSYLPELQIACNFNITCLI